MTSFREIQTRIGATRVVLEQQVGQRTMARVSTMQSRALASMLAAATDLDDVEKADITNLVVEIPWAAPDDCTAVLNALVGTDRRAAGTRQQRRRGLQDFTAVHGYMTEAFWQQMSGEIPSCNKLQVLLQACHRLGLRLPSEHTSKWLTCLWMYCSHSSDTLATQTPDQKLVYMKHLKRTFDGIRRSLLDPPLWIETLPTEPMDLASEHPAFFASVFSMQAKPVVAPIDMSSVIGLSQTFGCRGGLRSFLLGQPSISIPRPLPTGTIQLSPKREPPGSSLERMAGMFMTQMQNMAAMQNKFFEFKLGNGTAGGRQLRSLESVQDVRFLEDRRQSSALPALTHDTAMLVEELPESPQTPAAKTRLAGSTVSDIAKHVADPLESMLDALMVRTKAHAEVKAHAKAKAKAMPPPAKTASPVTHRVPDVAAATPSPAKKHKGATTVGSPPTAKAMASTPPSKAVASLASSSKSPSPKATSPPAKAAVVEAVAETSASAAVAKSKSNATISKMSKDDLAAAMRAMKKRNKILG